MAITIQSQVKQQLLNQGLVDQNQLKLAQRLTRLLHCPLQQALWRLNLLSLETYAEVTAAVTARPRLTEWRSRHPIDFGLSTVFAPEALLAYRFFPCRQHNGTITLAVERPNVRSIRQAVRQAWPEAKVRTVIATQHEIEQLIVEAGLHRALPASDLEDTTWWAVYQEARQVGTSVADALLGLELLQPEDYADIAAEQMGLPRFNRLFEDGTEVDANAASDFDSAALLSHLFVPLRWLDQKTLMVAIADPNAAQVEQQIYEKNPGCTLVKVIATPQEITELVDQLHQSALSWDARYRLLVRSPAESAARVFSLGQVILGGLLVCGFVVGITADLWGTLAAIAALLNIFFFVSIAYRLFLSLVGAADFVHTVSPEDVAALNEKTLPVYSILVPVYKEPEVLPILINALSELDYPHEKLDVLLLLEENDAETIAAAKAATPPAYMRFIYIPASAPQTKPKACNYGLSFARGEYITIYDAEDIPDPDQLKKVIVTFRKGPENLVCVQAALNYFNRDENLLTRLFTLEYSYWFDYLLPGLQTLGLPIPLGGTSNHFRLPLLLEMGGWDPFNVTEDADLGIRTAERGYRIGVVNSTTYEEANCHLPNWIRQRSRWLKGYMQTWLVHNRYPLRSLRRLGLKNWLSTQLFVGGTVLAFLSEPIVWGVFIYWLFTRADWLDYVFPNWILYLSLFNLLFGNALGVYLTMLAVFHRRYYGLVAYALLNPFYWILHSAAGYMALWQLFTKPFYWEKTVHGLSKIRPGANPDVPKSPLKRLNLPT